MRFCKLGCFLGVSVFNLIFCLSSAFGKEEDATLLLLVKESHVLEVVKNGGAKVEKKLKDLLRADYHQALAFYYLEREKSGFMALERCELAFERAIGDIREGAFIKNDKLRKEKIVMAFHNWQRALTKARFKNIPDGDLP